MVTNIRSGQNNKDVRQNKFVVVVSVLVLIWIIGFASAKIIEVAFGEDLITEGIAIIKIHGPITIDPTNTLTLTAGSSSSILSNIEKAQEDKNIKAIILDINSPGGAVVASRELSKVIKESEKPVVAWIREVGASGAYWIASSADKIVADSLSITGSIGVSASYLDLSGLLEKYDITYQELTAGSKKELGNPLKDLTAQERLILQKKIDRIQEVFIQDVVENRDLNPQQVAKISTGEFYLGEEAFQLGLVDVFGGRKEALAEARELANLTKLDVIEYKEKMSILEFFTKTTAYYIGKGIASELSSNKVPSIEIKA